MGSGGLIVLFDLASPSAAGARNLIACLFECMGGLILTTGLLFDQHVVNAIDERIFPANRAICADYRN